MTQEQFKALLPEFKEENYQINIEPLNYGFRISYGCQTLAIESVDKVIELLTFALKNPKLVRQYWNGMIPHEEVVSYN